MKKLNLPIIKSDNLKNKHVSMDEYLEFINFNLRYTFNRKAYEKWKKMLAVNIPFSLK